MKKFILLNLIYFTIQASAQNVNFTDANFKAALLANIAINTNADGEIQVSEAAAYTGTINVASKNIANMVGINTFTAITGLDCSYNQLTSLDVSQNTSIYSLYCSNNQLTSLNIPANTGLTSLDCSENQLTALNVSTNTSLTVLGCNNNHLSNLNLSTNASLGSLVCGNNLLSSLNLSNNAMLTSIDCGNNHLTSLNIISNTALITLGCYGNQLTQLDLSANLVIKYLNCQQNQIVSLNVMGNNALKEIRCYNNQLTSLNVKNGNNINFTAFYAYNNPGLACIQVDDAGYMNAQWPAGKDAAAIYSENCSTGSFEIGNRSDLISIHPNPSSGIFFVSFFYGKKDAKIRVIDNIGNCLVEINSSGSGNQEINLRDHRPGIYFLEVTTEKGERSVRKLTLQ